MHTVDFDTVGDEANGIAADHCVTIRERDSMEQVRIPIDQVKDFLREKCASEKSFPQNSKKDSSRKKAVLFLIPFGSAKFQQG